MKKILFVLLTLSITISINSCNNETDEDVESITDALKISAWLLDESLEGTGYWAYDLSTLDGGYWVSNEDNQQLDREDVFKFEQLELNHARVMAPFGYNMSHNLYIYFDFDGIIEIETAIPNDERVRLAYSLEEPSEPRVGNWTVENGFRTRAPFTLSFCPMGKYNIGTNTVIKATLTDQEYYLNIKAYEEDGTLAITAQLKFVVLKDDAYPYEQDSDSLFSPNEERSRFLSIELVSYEYNDIYKFDETSK